MFSLNIARQFGSFVLLSKTVSRVVEYHLSPWRIVRQYFPSSSNLEFISILLSRGPK